jgi:hypothetical protein
MGYFILLDCVIENVDKKTKYRGYLAFNPAMCGT